MNKILLLIAILTLTLIIAGCSQPGERIGSADVDATEMEEEDRGALAGNAIAPKSVKSPKPARSTASPCKGKQDGFQLEQCPTVTGNQKFCLQQSVNIRRCVNQVPDADRDTIPNARDNCPAVANQNQEDADEDGKGNLCDADTIVLQGCEQLQSRKTYVMENDIVVPLDWVDTCILPANHVIVDCQGHHLESQLDFGTGFGTLGNGNRLDSAYRYTNVTLRNCIIEGFDTAIELFSSDATIQNTTLRNNEIGATFAGSNTVVERVNLEDNIYGIIFNDMIGGVLRDTRSLSNDGGLEILRSTLTAERNTFCGGDEIWGDVFCLSNSDVNGNGNIFTRIYGRCAWGSDPTTHRNCPQQ